MGLIYYTGTLSLTNQEDINFVGYLLRQTQRDPESKIRPGNCNAKLIKHRQSKSVETRTVRLIAKSNYN